MAFLVWPSFTKSRLANCPKKCWLPQFIDNVYDKLKTNIKENKFQPYDSWVNFIEGNEVLDNLEETVSEIEFDEE